MAVNRKHIGETLDEFLKEEGIYEEVRRDATKMVLAFQLLDAMKKQGVTKVALARRMHTSRSSLDRILDPKNKAVTLDTLDRAAAALGRRLKVELEQNPAG
ncbi:MAG: helix-turn-helix transcriptional regulator [Planctomycetota bacterium]